VTANGSVASRRVDYILVTQASAHVLASRVVLDRPGHADGVLWPSDHYGVLTEVEIAAPK
jgi:endonuclease/exonuclease/phosphatase family metal-dependent hydrolase